MRKKVFTIMIYLLCLLAAAAVGGCGGNKEPDSMNGTIYYYPKDDADNAGGAQTVEEGVTADELEGLYLVVEVNSAEESIRLYRYTNGLEYQYYYSLATQFLDKYGNHTSVVNFTSGKVVTIEGVDEQGRISQVQIADNVWEYMDVTKYAVDEERKIFTIAGTRYGYDAGTQIISEGQRRKISDLTEHDKLCVTGIGKNILSIVITTGHGTLRLANTQLFEGSYLQLNSNIFVEITPNMEMDVPEGDYLLSVANDGWGGSCEITITRDEETEVDLDTIKGEGPKYGTILFAVDVEGAVIKIDGEKIDYSSTVQLRYGWHSMEVTAAGYDTWSKRLYVNSQEATIVIELTDEEDSKEDGTQTDESSGNSENQEHSDSSGDADSSDSTDNSREDELLNDYLSTLTELLGNL